MDASRRSAVAGSSHARAAAARKDAEATGGTEIGVICYGIQAENLKPVNPVDLTKNHYSLEELQNIYTIVKNKAGGQQ